MTETVPTTTSERLYQSVLQTVKYQTGGPKIDLPAALPKPNLVMQLVAYQNWGRRGVEQALEDAVDAGDLLVFRRNDQLHFVRTDDDSLRALIGAENQRDDPSTELIKAAVEQIGGDGGD